MTSSASISFFSRDAILHRQARTLRSRKLHAESISNTGKLNIIFEEDESSRASSPMSSYSPSTSRASSPALSVKARRRHANIADIRIAREIATHDDTDLSPLHDLLLQPSRPAPSPATSSLDSPDSFRLTFTDVSYTFPHPPTPSPSSLRNRGCVSPTESVSSFSSSPRTPVTSDDELSPSRPASARRHIHPLVIAKHNPRPSSPSDEISWSPSLLQPYKNSSEKLAGAVSPVDSFFLRSDSVYASDSDEDSDSEYYNRHFSKMLTLCSPTRRISKAVPASQELAAARRDSAVLPSEQVDHSFSSKRSNRTRSITIPKYPPPPPPIRRHSSVSSNSRSSNSTKDFPSPICNKTLSQSVQRPPPRSSIPADCDFELDIADDDESAFSFSMYAIDLDYGVEHNAESPKSPESVYSQPSFEVDDEGQEVTFDLDYSLMLPLSLPSSPIDLEADIALGLEKLRGEEDSAFDNVQFILEEEKETYEEQAQEIAQPQPEVVDDIFSPLSSTFSVSPPPSAATSSFSSFSYPSITPSVAHCNEERVLKSKWSSSTLGSVREEHERKGTSSKLLHYFSGTPSPLKRASASSKKVPPTPTSPFSSFMSPRKHSGKVYPSSPSPRAQKHSRGQSSSSDVMVIGYGHQGATGVRRRGSVTTISDAGSDVSFSSTSSSGLRRKPIPVEMFLRSAA